MVIEGKKKEGRYLVTSVVHILNFSHKRVLHKKIIYVILKMKVEETNIKKK